MFGVRSIFGDYCMCVSQNVMDIQTEVFLGNSGIMDEKRAEKTDFYRESNSGSETGSPVP